MSHPSRPAVFLALLLVIGGPAAAQSLGWRTFVHPQDGTRIDYPSALLPNIELTPTGVIFSGPIANLELVVTEITEVQTVADLWVYLASANGYENITYSPSGSSWLVLSGYRDTDIFYEKLFVVSGSIRGFSLEYPLAARATFDPLVEAMEDSFRSGT